MGEIIFESPLIWPKNQPQTARQDQRMDSGFSRSMTLDEALKYLRMEVEDFPDLRCILYTNIEWIDIDRKRRKIAPHSGVMMRARLGNHRYAIGCDEWQMIEHNIYALHLVLRNVRATQRWGVADVSVFMAGFIEDSNAAPATQAEAAPLTLPDWQEALGLGPTATLEDATAAYHRRAKVAHADQDKLTQLNLMMEKARDALKQ